jgi:hypothetical protein
LENNKIGGITTGGNFDELISGGLHEKHAAATWNLGTISAFA